VSVRGMDVVMLRGSVVRTDRVIPEVRVRVRIYG
jgi:hypothetical protein